eukprot:TRINITY_DN7163_c0_g1_i1.p2 TRINITY_DN7163_c0_g1~~TRINITY_DN7163_c0_g1_i1.p2  ORF type:complete len:148 (-),score=29.90 TRINITY_DN7163_c0_g1_i1:30-473(-)
MPLYHWLHAMYDPSLLTQQFVVDRGHELLSYVEYFFTTSLPLLLHKLYAIILDLAMEMQTVDWASLPQEFANNKGYSVFVLYCFVATVFCYLLYRIVYGIVETYINIITFLLCFVLPESILLYYGYAVLIPAIVENDWMAEFHSRLA